MAWHGVCGQGPRTTLERVPAPVPVPVPTDVSLPVLVPVCMRTVHPGHVPLLPRAGTRAVYSQERCVPVSVQTPELLADVEVPESVSILGQTVDLSQVRSLLQPVSQGLSGIITQVGVES